MPWLGLNAGSPPMENITVDHSISAWISLFQPGSLSFSYTLSHACFPAHALALLYCYMICNCAAKLWLAVGQNIVCQDRQTWKWQGAQNESLYHGTHHWHSKCIACCKTQRHMMMYIMRTTVDYQGPPRWPQEGPRWPQEGPKMGPKWPQERAKKMQKGYSVQEHVFAFFVPFQRPAKQWWKP